MKIKNNTRYPTRELRSIFCEVHNRIAKQEGRLRWWDRVEVEIVYSRGHERWKIVDDPEAPNGRRYERHRIPHSTGYAYLGGTYARLRLPKGECKRDSAAYLFGHELMHLYGYNHGQWVDRVAWREGIEGTLTEAPPKAKPRPDLQMKRYHDLLERRAEWEKKLRRAQNALKRIKPKVRYYERTLRAAGKIKEDS